MGITASLLTRRRLAAFVAVNACVVAWFLIAPHLGRVGLWPTVLLASFVIMPGTLLPVLIALPLRNHRWLFPSVGVLVLLAVLFTLADWGLPANFAKLWAAVFAGWAFVRLFERLSWVVLVAAIIPIVDIFSVWRGPTRAITQHHFAVYTTVAVAFVVPGHVSPVNLGPPDILFYALFLAAAARWNLRVGWTWVATSLMYGVTVIAATTFHKDGLPALPFLSFGFLVANADLLWRAMRPSEGSSESSPASS